MRRAFGVVLLAAAFSMPLGAAQQQANPYLTPEQQKQIAAMPALDESKRVQTDDIDKLLAEGNVVFLDVRERKEIEDLGTLEGYVNIPILELEKRLNELPKDKAILTA